MVKKLFVGQRVRILWSNSWPELAGEQGVIVAKAEDSGLNGISEWDVKPDCWDDPFAPYLSREGANFFSPNSSQLEPILPQGAQPLGYSFEQMMSEFGVAEAVK